MANHAANAALEANDHLECSIFGKLAGTGSDECRGVRDRMRLIHPRQPFSQMLPVGVGQIENLLGMLFLKQFQINFVRDLQMKWCWYHFECSKISGIMPRKE